jgi:cytosine/adenosine deaminase-related metal-dependent hydrolase
MTDLLIHDAIVVTMDRENRVLENGSVRVSDGTVSSVEPTDPADRDATASRVIDADGKVVMPGLVDAHRHTDFTLVQGLFSELAVLMADRSVESMDVESVRAAATRERERLESRTGWETSLAGSTPPDESILR